MTPHLLRRCHRAGNFTVTPILHTTRMRSPRLGRVTSVAVLPTNKQTKCPSRGWAKPCCACGGCHPHLTRWNHLHFGVGVVGITQKKVWAAGSPLSERWNKARAFEESLRRRCGPMAHRSKDSEIECGPSAPTEWTVKSRWNTFFTFPPFLRGSLIVKTALLVVWHYSFGTNSSDIAPSTGP